MKKVVVLVPAVAAAAALTAGLAACGVSGANMVTTWNAGSGVVVKETIPGPTIGGPQPNLLIHNSGDLGRAPGSVTLPGAKEQASRFAPSKALCVVHRPGHVVWSVWAVNSAGRPDWNAASADIAANYCNFLMGDIGRP